MKFYQISLAVFFIGISLVLCSIEDSDHDSEHHEPEVSDHPYNSAFDTDYEPQEFDHDPHEANSDYDEEMLTGTSHHSKDQKSKEETKIEIDEIFTNADKNKDGKIDRAELINFIIQNIKTLQNESAHEEFSKINKDNDTRISLDEYFMYHHGKSGAELDKIDPTDKTPKTIELLQRIKHERDRFKAADSNSDGYLDVQEYLLMKFPLFFPHMAHTIIHEYIEDLDTNKDGLVDKTEYTTHFDAADHKNKSHGEEMKKKHEADFDKYDKDKNGKIDPEEYLAVLKPGYDEPAHQETEYLFQMTDKNEDGFVTLDEIEKQAQSWIGGESLDTDESHHYDDEL